jgi:hypothetical protein
MSVLPVVANPKPGDPAEGLRILSTRWKGGQYLVEVEGLSGSSGELEFWSANEGTVNPEGAVWVNRNGHLNRIRVDFKPSESKYQVQTVSVPIMLLK